MDYRLFTSNISCYFYPTKIILLGTPVTLPAGAHPAAPLLRHAAEHGVLIALRQGIGKEEKESDLCCGTHVSAVKETEFTLLISKKNPSGP